MASKLETWGRRADVRSDAKWEPLYDREWRLAERRELADSSLSALELIAG
jgi:hypothetical protein